MLQGSATEVRRSFAEKECQRLPKPDGQSPALLSAESLAQMIQVSVRTVWRLRSSGKLPRPVKVGGSIRWRADEVQNWIEDGCPAYAEWELHKSVTGK